MKLTDKQKKQLRKEVEQEKRPRILNFETEINKKKNQDKTIEEIMQMVAESKEVAKTFINDPEERFQKRLAELKIQELDKVRKDYNKTRFTDFSLKTFKRFNGAIADFDELTAFLDEFICLVNINNNTVRKNWRIWGEVAESVNYLAWRKACRALKKDQPKIKITLKEFMLQNKNLTVGQAKKQFEELTASVPEPTFYEFAMNQMEVIFSKITNNPKQFIELIAQTKLKRSITKETYAIEKDIDRIVQFEILFLTLLSKTKRTKTLSDKKIMFFDFIVDDLKFLLYNWITNKKRGKTMNFKERKQLEEVLLKNIYKNLRNDLEKIGKTNFIYDDSWPKIEVDDTAKNYRTIYILFQENQLSIMFCYNYGSYSFTQHGAEKLLENNYTFSINYQDELIIERYLNDSSEILPELETNMVQPSR